MEGFFAGCFNTNGETVLKAHIAGEYDDDVLSWVFESGNNKIFKDGFVSNKGNVVTIHIADDCIAKVELIKEWFGLKDNPDIKLEVEGFTGWDVKPADR